MKNKKAKNQRIKKSSHSKSEKKADASHAAGSVPVHADDANPYNNDHLFKKIFYASLVVMLAVLWVSGYDVPFHSDEMDMNVYAKNNIAFYASGGADTSYLHIDQDDGMPDNPRLRYYTCGFDYLAIAVNSVIGNADGYEYNVRHALNQLFAVLAILFAGLIARTLVNYRAGVITIWLLYLTPMFFGLALFDTKDIPFSAGYIASLYFILRFLKGLPRVNWRVITGLVISIAFACSVRIGGLLLLAYLGCFTIIYLLQNRSLLKGQNRLLKIIGAVTLVSVLVMLVTVLGWPYVLTSPVEHMKEALNVATSFPQRIPFNFNGDLIDSLQVPKSYLLIYFIRTVPVLILAAFCGSLMMIYLRNEQLYKMGVWLLLAAIVFPVLYAISKEVSLYNSWRHFLFIYAPFVIIAGLGTELFIQQLKKPVYRYVILFVLVSGMLHPLLWTVRSHPYEYMYYNEAAGGFKNNYYSFETDYWQMSTREGLDWLIEHEHLLEAKDTVTIATNSISVFKYYIKKRYPEAKIKIVYSGFSKRTLRPWKYGIFSNLFLSVHVLEHDYPPKENLLHTIDVDGMPITVLIKDTLRYDKLALDYYYQNRVREADSVFNLLRQIHKGHDDAQYKPLLPFMGFCKAAIGQFDSAQYFAEKAIAYDKFGYEGNLLMGLLARQRHDFVNARKYLTSAVRVKPNDTATINILRKLPAPHR